MSAGRGNGERERVLARILCVRLMLFVTESPPSVAKNPRAARGGGGGEERRKEEEVKEARGPVHEPFTAERARNCRWRFQSDASSLFLFIYIFIYTFLDRRDSLVWTHPPYQFFPLF